MSIRLIFPSYGPQFVDGPWGAQSHPQKLQSLIDYLLHEEMDNWWRPIIALHALRAHVVIDISITGQWQ